MSPRELSPRELCQRAGGQCLDCPANQGCYPRGAGERPVLCCHCPDAEEYASEVSGLTLDQYWIQPELPALPEEVELLKDYMPHRVAVCYAASLNMLYSSGFCVPRWNARHALGLREEDGLLVMGNARDGLIDAVWARRDFGIFEALRSFAPVVVTTPDFSVYAKEPFLERLINMKRSLLCGLRLYALGLTPVVTMLYSGLSEVCLWQVWLERGGVDQHTIAVNAQGIIGGAAWSTWLLGLSMLAMVRPLTFIVSGVALSRRKEQVRRALEVVQPGSRVVFVASTGLLAAFGRAVDVAVSSLVPEPVGGPLRV